MDYWDEVYGVDMSSMAGFAKKSAFGECVVATIHESKLLDAGACVATMDCSSADESGESLVLPAPFEFVLERGGALHGFVAWFDVQFGPEVVMLSTSPDAVPGHWMQTLLYLDEPLAVTKGQKLSGSFSLRPDAANVRRISVTVEFEGQSRTWKM